METYSRIGLLRSLGNLQSYWTTSKLFTVVLDYREAMDSYSRIEILQCLYLGKVMTNSLVFHSDLPHDKMKPKFTENQVVKKVKHTPNE